MKIGKISGRKLYTAKEYLKMPEYKITGKLKSEIERLESSYKESKQSGKKRKKKTIKFEELLSELEKIPNIIIEKKSDYYSIKDEKKVICWIAERGYGISFMTWGKGGEDFKTEKLKEKEEIKKVVNYVSK